MRKTEIYETAAPAETFELGKKLGSLAQPGTIICLNGDLGTGKTVFTQGFAAGLGITEPVSSPISVHPASSAARNIAETCELFT